MPELSSRDFEQIMPLVGASGMRGHLALVHEVLEGHRAGQIFVDDQTDPHTALVCSTSGFFFAFGQPNEEILRQVIERFWTPGHDPYFTTLFGSHPDWNEPLQKAFAGLPSRQEKRLAFELHKMPA